MRSLIFIVACKPCSTWDLVSWPGIKPEPAALGAQSLNHWATGDVPRVSFWGNENGLKLSVEIIAHFCDYAKNYWTTAFRQVGCCLVTKSCPTLCDPTDCSPPGSSVNGILKEKILEWVALSFSRGSSSRGMNLSLLHCRQILHHLSHQGSPLL